MKKIIQTDAQEKISAADAEIIRLQGELKQLTDETVTALGSMNASIRTAEPTIAGIRDLYITEMALAAGAPATNTASTATNTSTMVTTLVSLETLFRTRFPVASWWTTHQTGVDRVPYDNYPAMLHKGESVVRARESGSSVSMPINLTVNAGAGADGKKIVEQLKNEIKWGNLGNLIVPPTGY